MNALAGRVYFGEVMHRRLFPVSYRFLYRVFSVLIDIERIDELSKTSSLFSHNRFNLISFHDRDHGPRDGSSLRRWIDKVLEGFGIDLHGGRVQLLCFPRILGYGFNPLSIWYCHDAAGELRAVLCEVRNTFGEQHSYLLHEGGRAMTWPVRQTRSKGFHVSPFIGMEAEYHFKLSEPTETLQIMIREYEDDRLMLAAAQVAEARPFTTPTLVRALLVLPLMTLKVMAMIHWQALKIWLKGAPFFPKPTPPTQEVS